MKLRSLRSELLGAREQQRAQAEDLTRREAQHEERQREREQQHALSVERLRLKERQAQVMSLGLRDAGGQLVARMQQLREDVAARCQQVEQSARDDVRRTSREAGCMPYPLTLTGRLYNPLYKEI